MVDLGVFLGYQLVLSDLSKQLHSFRFHKLFFDIYHSLLCTKFRILRLDDGILQPIFVNKYALEELLSIKCAVLILKRLLDYAHVLLEF